MEESGEIYDVIIIGGGTSGTALLYTLAKYTDIKRILLLEKCDRAGQVNSKASNNSQTLHIGDIETNYSLEKVRQVFPAAMMVPEYVRGLPAEAQSKILFTVPKMILSVGEKEIAALEKRYENLHELFPSLQKLSREEIAKIEPAVVEGRKKNVPLLALHTEEGYAVNFEELSKSFAEEALRASSACSISYKSTVSSIEKENSGTYLLRRKGQARVRAKVVIVDADSYSLFFAKQLGYGKNFSLIPIAGSFYFSKEMLRGKVYTMQEPMLPFAAVHGDPDVCVSGVTRWGPTARFKPVLESRNGKTRSDYLRSSGLGKGRTWGSFLKILCEPVRARFFIKNMLYELPYAGKQLFLLQARKIAPSIKARDLKKASGYGGMRLQRVNTDTSELELGEAKIIGDNIIFNMTPSPGASVCLYNALRDAEHVTAFLKGEYVFKRADMESDLVKGLPLSF